MKLFLTVAWQIFNISFFILLAYLLVKLYKKVKST